MKKLQNNRGATLVVSLLFFTVIAVISSILLTAITRSNNRTGTLSSNHQPYYSVSSAAKLIKTLIEESSFEFEEKDNAEDFDLSAKTALPDDFKKSIKDIYMFSGPTKNLPLSIKSNNSSLKDLNITKASFMIDSNYDITVTIKKEIKGSTYICEVYSPAIVTVTTNKTLITWDKAIIRKVGLNNNDNR